MARKRLDLLLLERGLFETQKEAEAAVREGRIRAGGRVADKPGQPFDPSVDLEVFNAPGKYVSRGGLKLEHALKEFGVRVEGRVAFDAGASTGGFTDCLLQTGAAHVVAADVGYGQLAWRLRRDSRVELWERTNLREPPKDLVHRWHNRVEIMTLDLSFISLCLIFPAVAPLLAPSSDIIALVKPQFEVAREKVGRRGVVDNAEDQVTAIEKVTGCARAAGFEPVNAVASPLRGPEGNLEFFLHLKKTPAGPPAIPLDFNALVRRAHETVP